MIPYIFSARRAEAFGHGEKYFVKNRSKFVTAALLLSVGLGGVSAGSSPAWAQLADGPRPSAPDNTPLPEPNMANLIKTYGLIESKLPAREFIKGWRKPKKSSPFWTTMFTAWTG